MIAGRLGSPGLELSEAHRFANTTVSLPDGLHWNVLSLFGEMLAGLAKAVRGGAEGSPGIGIDAWGVDYGLLDGADRLLGIPFHYRDRRTDGMIELRRPRRRRPSSTRGPASRRCRSTPSSSCSPSRTARRWQPPSTWR